MIAIETAQMPWNSKQESIKEKRIASRDLGPPAQSGARCARTTLRSSQHTLAIGASVAICLVSLVESSSPILLYESLIGCCLQKPTGIIRQRSWRVSRKLLVENTVINSQNRHEFGENTGIDSQNRHEIGENIQNRHEFVEKCENFLNLVEF